MYTAPAFCRKLVVLLLFALSGGSFAAAQISPAEITNPRLKAPEQAYFQQLIALNRAIGKIKFPFAFSLRRYIGLGPKNPLRADTRGIEYVVFHDHVILKISGDYAAALNADLMTRNQRARAVFKHVMLPILGLLPRYFPGSAKFDGVGVEVAYHVRTHTHRYQFEGVEILTLVLNKPDALNYLRVTDEAGRQKILDSSQIYLDDKRFGLALEGREPYPTEALEGAWNNTPTSLSENHKPRPAGRANSISAEPESSSAGTAAINIVRSDRQSGLRPPVDAIPAGAATLPVKPVPKANAAVPASSRNERGATQTELNGLQNEYALQFQALAKDGVERYHFVSRPAPFLITFHHQIYLQLTLRNPTPFDRDTTSIYKRAAQDFDLFLGPMLKSILANVPNDAKLAGVDITVLDKFGARASDTSEAIEFICPLPVLRQFASARVTSQYVINQSVVVVNGVRIGLDLERAE